MRIVFYGENATAFSDGFAALAGGGSEIVILPDRLETAADRAAFAGADVIIGTRFDASLPRASMHRCQGHCHGNRLWQRVRRAIRVVG